jgi:HlyD family secretion protein
MTPFGATGRRRPLRILITLVVIGLAVTAAFAMVTRGSAPNLPTVVVAKGDFIDAIEIRGEIRPAKSIMLSAPMQSGDLQIVKLAKNGTPVKAGDVVVQFDGSVLERTVQEKRSELKQADAEIEQATAQGRITHEQNATALMKAQYDVQRAKLDVAKGDTVSRIENEQAKLTLGDTQQKLLELEAKIKSDQTSSDADLAAKRRKREKALFDLTRAERSLQNLQLKAPAAGTVNILPNYRNSGPFSADVEFREGDRAYPGAAILELPDLSTVHLEARLEEADRGRLKTGQDATVRIEAVPGRDFKARIDLISVLARVDFSSGWPPSRNFDLGFVLTEIDPRIRPGMSAVARIATNRVPNVVLVPTESVFQRDGYPVVYKLNGAVFDEQRLQVARRGREQTIVASGVAPGDRIATRKPAAEMIRRAQ